MIKNKRQHGLFETEDLDDFESEEDSKAAGSQMLSNVVIQDSDWTVETIINQINKQNIDLSPRFQRRDAWTDERKSKFIESLFLGIPIPQIVLAQSKLHRGRFIIIDGKQRLLALKAFAGHSDRPPLILRGLTVRDDLNGLSWEKISGGGARFDDADAFENTTIRTTVIKGYETEDVLYTIYHRLNSGSVPLSPQELRHVLKPGPFIDFAFDFSETSRSFIKLFGKDDCPDFRMRDIEMLIRYFGLTEELPNYRGDLKSFLDLTVDELNTNWNILCFHVMHSAEECEMAIAATLEIFGKHAFRKPKENGFESRFNRAIYDIMVYYFSEPAIRKAAQEKGAEIISSFVELCRDMSFVRSIESTTKTTVALGTRLIKWGEALERLLVLESQRLVQAKIAFGSIVS